MLLEGRVAVVTGAAIGIGAEIATRYAAEGAHVVVADVDEAGEATAARIGGEAGNAEFARLDVSDVGGVRAEFAAIAARHGRIDVLVNNAGITRSAGLLDLEEDDWDRIMSINAKGVMFCLQAAASHMIERRSGAIVNISSISGKGWRHASNIAYAASKGAVLSVTRIAAAQLAQHGIRVNAICPGTTETDFFKGHLAALAEQEQKSVEEVRERFLDLIPLRLTNEPADIAATAAFLASDQARTITGQSLNVDGGILND